jgi:hypothetical protein
MGFINHTQTKSFAEITNYLIVNTLVIIDLDNTLFNYGPRCAIATDKQIEQTGDSVLLNSLIPKINDFDGFRKLELAAKWSESKIIFLTARTKSQQVATRIILSKYKIHYPVLYAGFVPKGEYLLNTDFEIFKKIIFVDDLDENLYSVKQIEDLIQIPIQTFKFTNS